MIVGSKYDRNQSRNYLPVATHYRRQHPVVAAFHKVVSAIVRYGFFMMVGAYLYSQLVRHC